MSGTINLQDPLLQQVEKKIESQLLPGVRADYDKIVLAGLRAGLAENGKIMNMIADSKDPLSDVVKGAISLVGVLRKQSRGTMPLKAMIPAAFTLMVQGLDYADRAGVLEVDAAVVDQATEMFAETIMKLLGVSQAALQNLATQVNGVMQDPAKMVQLKGEAGVNPYGAA